MGKIECISLLKDDKEFLSEVIKKYSLIEETPEQLKALYGMWIERKQLNNTFLNNISSIQYNDYMKDFINFYQAYRFKVLVTDTNDIQRLVKDTNGINTLPSNDDQMHFGNPFDIKKAPHVVKVVKEVKEAVNNFLEWLLGIDFHNIEPERRKWIMDQIYSGKLSGKPLIYDTDTIPDNSYGTNKYNYETAPNHAYILKRLINFYTAKTHAIILNGKKEQAVIKGQRLYVNGTLYKGRTFTLPYKNETYLIVESPTSTFIFDSKGRRIDSQMLEQFRNSIDKIKALTDIIYYNNPYNQQNKQSQQPQQNRQVQIPERIDIPYTINNKKQIYTIVNNSDGIHIFNKAGKEVYTDEKNGNRRAILANYKIKTKQAVVVNYRDADYIVDINNEILSKTSKKVVYADEKNGNRKAILEMAKPEFDKLFSQNPVTNEQPISQNTSETNKPVTSIPQNRVSGEHQYGFTQTARPEVIKALGEGATSIDMVEAGFRTRTTRSVSESEKYNLKVGDVFEQYGKSKDGTIKRILTRVTAIYGKDDPRYESNWNKEGWTDEGIDDIRRLKDGAVCIEFEKVKTDNKEQSVKEKEVITVHNEILETLGGKDDVNAESEVKDTVKVAKKGISFEEALSTVTPVFTKEEIDQIKKSLNGKNLQVMSVSRQTDPVQFSKEIIDFLKINSKKPFTDPTRVNVIELWTKHDGIPLRDILEACKKYKVAPMVSFSITGMGNSAIEKGVLKYNDLLNLIGELVKDKVLDPRTTTVRIDPILVGYSNMDAIKEIVNKSKALGIKKFVTSLVQSYGYLDGTPQDRKVTSGINKALAKEGQTYDWDKYYGIITEDDYRKSSDFISEYKKSHPTASWAELISAGMKARVRVVSRTNIGKIHFVPKIDYIEEVSNVLKELNEDPEIEIESCSFSINGLKHSACLDPLIIERITGVNVMRKDGTYDRDTSRPECMCYGAHSDMFKVNQKKCFSGCAYCYAAHSGDNNIIYYNDDGTLKDIPYTRAREESKEHHSNVKWDRYSTNNYEVSSKGDSRFSATEAKFNDGTIIHGINVGGYTIEEVYQTLLKEGKLRHFAKNHKKEKGIFKKEGYLNYPTKDGENISTKTLEDYSYKMGYLPLWQEWARQNPDLIEDLRIKVADKTLTDQFANTRVSQARALADILNDNKEGIETTQQSQINESPETIETKEKDLSEQIESVKNIDLKLTSKRKYTLNPGQITDCVDHVFLRALKVIDEVRSKKKYDRFLEVINHISGGLNTIYEFIKKRDLNQGESIPSQLKWFYENFDNYKEGITAKLLRTYNIPLRKLNESVLSDEKVLDIENDNFLDGTSTKESYQEKPEHSLFNNTLTEKISETTSRICKFNKNGFYIFNSLDEPSYYSSEQINNILVSILQNMAISGKINGVDDMMERLENEKNKYLWISQKEMKDGQEVEKKGTLFYYLKNDRALQTLFYTKFHVQNVKYTIISGEMIKEVSKTVNENVILEDIEQNIKSGFVAPENKNYSLYDKEGKIIKSNINEIEKIGEKITDIENKIKEELEEQNRFKKKDYALALLRHEEFYKLFSKLINIVGINKNYEEIRDLLLKNPKRLLNLERYIINIINDIEKKEVEGQDFFTYNRGRINKIATLLKELHNVVYENISIENGKMYQSNLYPSFKSEFIQGLKKNCREAIREYYGIKGENGKYTFPKWFYHNGSWHNSILKKMMESSDYTANVDITRVIHYNKVKYENMTPEQIIEMNILMFFSSVVELGYRWYNFPVLSDSKNAEFIKLHSYDGENFEDQILDELVILINQEHQRISDYIKNEDKENGFETGYTKSAKKYNFIPEFQEYADQYNELLQQDHSKAKVFLRQTLKKIFENKFKEEYKFYRDKKIIEHFVNKGNKFLLERDTFYTDAKDYIEKLLEGYEKEGNPLQDIFDKEDISFLKGLKFKLETFDFFDFNDEQYIQKVKDLFGKINKYKSTIETIIGKIISDNARFNFIFNENLSFIKNFQEIFKKFFYNNTYMQSQIIQMFYIDLAYYEKGYKEFQKRAKAVNSYLERPDTSAEYIDENGETKKVSKEERVIYLEDVIEESTMLSYIKEYIKENFSPQDSEIIFNSLKKIVATDGQSFRTLPSYRQIEAMFGTWDAGKRTEYEALVSGDEEEQRDILDDIADARYDEYKKPMFYGFEKVVTQNKNGESEMRVIPVYHKTSESILLYLYDKILADNNEKMRKLNEFMVKNKIDRVIFKSGVKTGAFNVVKLEDVLNYHDGKESNIKDLEKIVHKLPYIYYGKQQNTPSHFMDQERAIGTQVLKIILSTIKDDWNFKLGNKNVDGKTIKKLYMNILTEKMLKGLFPLIFKNQREIYDVIKDTIKNNPRYNVTIENAIELVKNKDGEEEFTLPLSDPGISSQIASLLLSMFRNRITKMVTSGGSVTQMSGIGHDNLGITFKDKQGHIYTLSEDNKEKIKSLLKKKEISVNSIDIILPRTTKKFMGKDIDDIPENLKNIVGYRIPTSKLSLILPFRVVGFSSDLAGGVAYVPKEISYFQGSDYDYDSIYLITPEIRYKHPSKRQFLDYIEEARAIKDITEEDLQNVIDKYYIDKLENMSEEEFMEKYKSLLISSNIDLFIEVIENLSEKEFNIILDRIDNSEIDWEEGSVGYYVDEFYKQSHVYKKIEKVPYHLDENLEIDRLNKAELNNLLFDIIYSTITNDKAFSDMMIPSNYELWKEAAKLITIIKNNKNISNEDIQKLKEDPKSIDEKFQEIIFDPLTLSTFTSFHEENMTGQKLIGLYAVMKGFQEILQNTNIKLNEKYKFNLGDYSINLELNDHKAGEEIGQLVDASADNTKEQILSLMNQNFLTAGVTTLLIMLKSKHGNIQQNYIDICAFMNQKIIREISDKYNSGASFNVEKNDLIQEYLNLYSKNITSDERKEIDENFTTDRDLYSSENLIKGLKNENDSKYQYAIGVLFQHLTMISETLSKLISREDTTAGAAGSTLAKIMLGIIKKEKNYNDLLNSDIFKNVFSEDSSLVVPNEKKIEKEITSYKEKTTNSDEDQKKIIDLTKERIKKIITSSIGENTRDLIYSQSFYSLGLESVIPILKFIFPELNLKSFILDIDDHMKSNITEPIIRDIFIAYYNYKLSQISFFGDDEEETMEKKRNYYINSFPQKFMGEVEKIISTKSNDMSNDLIDRIDFLSHFKLYKEKNGDEVLKFDGISNLSDNQIKRYQEIWEGLTNQSQDPTLHSFAFELVRYQYYKYGMGQSLKGFSKLIPVNIKAAIPGYKEVVGQFNEEEFNSSVFRELFFRNNLNIKQLVPEIQGENESFIDDDEITIVFDKDIPIKFKKLISKRNIGNKPEETTYLTHYFFGIKSGDKVIYYKLKSGYEGYGKVFIYEKTTPISFNKNNPNYNCNIQNIKTNKSEEKVEFEDEDVTIKDSGSENNDIVDNSEDVNDYISQTGAQKEDVEKKDENTEQEDIKRQLADAEYVDLDEDENEDEDNEDNDTTPKFQKQYTHLNETIEEMKKKYDELLNEKLRALLNRLGIPIEALKATQEALKLNGIVEYTSEKILKVIKPIIRLANGIRGEIALPEEASHIFVRLLGANNPLTSRLINLLQNEQVLRQIFGEDYENYYKDYHGDMTLMAEEAAGKLIANEMSSVNKEIEEKKKDTLWQSIKRLVKRWIQNIKERFKRSSIKESDIESIISEARSQAQKVAKGILSEELIPQMSNENIYSTEEQRQYTNSMNKNKKILGKIIETQLKKLKLFKESLDRDLQENEIRKIYNDNRDLFSNFETFEALLGSFEGNIKLMSNYVKNALKKASEEEIDTLIKKYNQNRSIEGITQYLNSAIQNLKDIIERFKNYAQISKDLDIKEKALELRKIKNEIFSYKDSINDILQALEEENLSNDENEQVLNNIKEEIINANLLYERALKQYEIITMPLFANFLKNWLGNDSIDIPLRKHQTKKVSIEDLLKTADYDIGFFDKWLDSMADSTDDMLKIIDSIVKEYKHRARLRSIEVMKEIERAGMELEDAGVKNYDFMFERDENGNLTGSYAQRINYGLFKRKKAEFFKDLHRRYNGNLTEPEKLSMKEEIKQWYRDNTEIKYGIQVPKESLYLNKDFASLDPNGPEMKFYNTIMEIKKKMDNLLPVDYTDLYNTVKIRKDLVERVKSSDSAKGVLSAISESIKDKFIERTDDTDFGIKPTIKDFEGREVQILPIYYTKMKKGENINDMSRDVVSTMAAYASMAIDYSEMNEVIDILEIGRDILRKRKFGVTRGGELLKEKFTQMNIDVTNPVQKSYEESNFGSKLDHYYEAQIYNRYDKDEGTFGKKISKQKTAKFLNQLSSLIYISFHAPLGVANVLVGKVMMRIEAIARQFFTEKNVLHADKIYAKNIPGVLAEIGERIKTNKLSLWNEKFNVLQEYEQDIKEIDFDKKTWFSRLFNTSTLYMFMSGGEHWMHTRTSLALADNYKMLDDQGNEVSLWDAYEVVFLDENNPSHGAKLQIKEGYTKLDGTEFTEKDLIEFINKTDKLNQNMHGVYNKLDRSIIQRFWLGKMVILFRKWIPSALTRRFGAYRYDRSLKIESEGYYMTMGKFLLNVVKDLKKLKFNALYRFNELEEYEKANMRRAITEIAHWLIVGLLVGLIDWKGGDDDDDDDDDKNKWFIKTVEYQIRRLNTELGALVPSHKMLNEGWKILKSPSANINTIDNITDLLTLINPFRIKYNYIEEIQSGRYKGMSRAERAVRRLLPVYRGIDMTVHPAQNISFLKQ